MKSKDESFTYDEIITLDKKFCTNISRNKCLFRLSQQTLFFFHLRITNLDKKVITGFFLNTFYRVRKVIKSKKANTR